MSMFHLEHALDLAWSTVIKMVDGFFSLLPNLIVGMIVLALFLYLAGISKNLTTRLATKAKLDITLASALGTICSVMVSVFGVLTTAVIVIPTFSMAHMIGGLGISSVAIGFAFKDILQNFFAGILLLWQKPFGIGDQIKTGSFEGTVEDIRVRSTLLRTFEGELVLIPNGDIYTNPIIVSYAKGKREVHLTVNAKNAKSVEEARKQITDVLKSVDTVLKEPAPRVFVMDANSENLSFEVHFWTPAKHSDSIATTDAVASRLRDLFFSAKPEEPSQQPSELRRAS